MKNSRSSKPFERLVQLSYSRARSVQYKTSKTMDMEHEAAFFLDNKTKPRDTRKITKYFNIIPNTTGQEVGNINLTTHNNSSKTSKKNVNSRRAKNNRENNKRTENNNTKKLLTETRKFRRRI